MISLGENTDQQMILLGDNIAEVEFVTAVTAVTAGGSVNFLPAE